MVIYNIEFFSEDIEIQLKQRQYLSTLTVLDVIMISRYLYTIGEEPLLMDKTYEQLLDKPEFSYLKAVRYEDDELTEKLMNQLKTLGVYREIKYDDTLRDKLKIASLFETNTSMLCVTNVKDLQDKYISHYLNEHTEHFLLSYKHDGWNVTCYYIPDEDSVYYGHTRGRDGATARDVTELMGKILPNMKVQYETKVVMELVVKKSKLDYLRKKYPDRKWVNARNSVASFVAGGVEEEDYDCLDYFALGYYDLSGNKVGAKDPFEMLKSKGFNIPIYCKFKPNIREVIDNLKKLEDFYMNEYEKEYECDGLVMVAVTETVNKEVFTSYSSGMVAIKAGYWSAEILEAEIVEIYYGQNKSSFTPKARIKPLISKSGSEIRNVPLINLGVVARNWLCPGDKIIIEYHSQQNVNFIGKVKVKI